MGSRKYKQGKKITSLQEFEKSDCLWFKVKYGADDFKLFHRCALESLTVKTLRNWIYNDRLFETIKTKQEQFLVVDEFVGMGKEDVIEFIEKFGLAKNGLNEKDRKVLKMSIKMLKQKENKNE